MCLFSQFGVYLVQAYSVHDHLRFQMWQFGQLRIYLSLALDEFAETVVERSSCGSLRGLSYADGHLSPFEDNRHYAGVFHKHVCHHDRIHETIETKLSMNDTGRINSTHIISSINLQVESLSFEPLHIGSSTDHILICAGDEQSKRCENGQLRNPHISLETILILFFISAVSGKRHISCMYHASSLTT